MRRLMTLTFGEFPDNVLEIMEPHCPFYMGLRGEDFRSVERAINQGIDSYLEAVQFTQTGNRVDVTDAASLKTLVRRLAEDEHEESQGLASAIMEIVGIEWV